jgi:hypothetical protein
MVAHGPGFAWSETLSGQLKPSLVWSLWAGGRSRSASATRR